MLEPITEALELLKRQAGLEAGLRLAGGIRVTEERELYAVRAKLDALRPTSPRVRIGGYAVTSSHPNIRTDALPVEVLRADCKILGIDIPIRESGDLIGTPGITIEGPRSRVQLLCGPICAQRHIHMSPSEATRLGLRDGDRVNVTTEGNQRGMVHRDVIVRVSDGYRLELHMDVDEANAGALREGDYAVLERDSAVRRETEVLEAKVGIEPAYTALQAAA